MQPNNPGASQKIRNGAGNTTVQIKGDLIMLQKWYVFGCGMASLC